MKQIKHSLADWDYDPGGFWYIDNTLFVSPPSCLAVPDHNWPDSLDWVFLKSTLAPNLKQGRMITFDRFMTAAWGTFRTWFRAQALPSPDVCADAYRVEITHNTWKIQSVVAGAWTILFNGNLTFVRQPNTWYKHRFTFHTYTTAGLLFALRMVWEIEIAGEWVVQFDEEIVDPLWQDSAVNLIGFNFATVSTTKKHYMDDTEIWEKT